MGLQDEAVTKELDETLQEALSEVLKMLEETVMMK